MGAGLCLTMTELETPLLATENDGANTSDVHSLSSKSRNINNSVTAPPSSSSPTVIDKLTCLDFLTDESGSFPQIVLLLISLFVVGTIFGIILPKDSDFDTTWYPYFSSILGATYFVAWSISFYPQILLNCRRQSTAGLSYDFCILNVIGFFCYMVYNCALFWGPSVRREYRYRHDGTDNLVEPSDVSFAIHAFIMSSVTLSQILWYNKERKPSAWVLNFVLLFVVFVFAHVIFTSTSESRSWLDFVYFLSYVKIAITLTKYTPQALLNFSRKSTKGWNIWNVVLDLTGGTLSLLQLILDSWNTKDWSGIIGNPAKLGISLISILFDVSIAHF